MSSVFVIREDGSLEPMKQSGFESEDVLQNLIAKNPDLLAGDLIDEKNPRNWLLIDREYGIPDKDDSSDRWSIDHLFLDQDGIPTLVEVKRSSDTRIRREVVGQMLDYAANALQYWNIERIIASYENKCLESGFEPQEKWSQTLNLETDYQDFWENVKTNLEMGKIRLLFVADDIPFELRQIVEFLNTHMDTIEVLAVELKQYKGTFMKTLIPRVYGQTTQTQIKKKKTKSAKITKEEFLATLNENGVHFFSNLFKLSEEKGYEFNWGTVGFSINVKVEGKKVAFCLGYPPTKNSEQYIYVDFNLLGRRITESEVVTESYKDRFLELGFSRAGNDVKWIIDSPPSDEQIMKVTNLCFELAESIKSKTLK